MVVFTILYNPPTVKILLFLKIISKKRKALQQMPKGLNVLAPPIGNTSNF